MKWKCPDCGLEIDSTLPDAPTCIECVVSMVSQPEHAEPVPDEPTEVLETSFDPAVYDRKASEPSDWKSKVRFKGESHPTIPKKIKPNWVMVTEEDEAEVSEADPSPEVETASRTEPVNSSSNRYADLLRELVEVAPKRRSRRAVVSVDEPQETSCSCDPPEQPGPAQFKFEVDWSSVSDYDRAVPKSRKLNLSQVDENCFHVMNANGRTAIGAVWREQHDGVTLEWKAFCMHPKTYGPLGAFRTKEDAEKSLSDALQAANAVLQ
jgi:hypothetical protein